MKLILKNNLGEIISIEERCICYDSIESIEKNNGLCNCEGKTKNIIYPNFKNIKELKESLYNWLSEIPQLIPKDYNKTYFDFIYENKHHRIKVYDDLSCKYQYTDMESDGKYYSTVDILLEIVFDLNNELSLNKESKKILGTDLYEVYLKLKRLEHNDEWLDIPNNYYMKTASMEYKGSTLDFFYHTNSCYYIVNVKKETYIDTVQNEDLLTALKMLYGKETPVLKKPGLMPIKRVESIVYDFEDFDFSTYCEAQFKEALTVDLLSGRSVLILNSGPADITLSYDIDKKLYTYSIPETFHHTHPADIYMEHPSLARILACKVAPELERLSHYRS